jgi:hypothetical protein
MCGIMADMQIIFDLMKSYMPQIYAIVQEKDEYCGDFIGNNVINQGLNNLFTNDMLNNDTSLLIWDLLFLEGNIVLFKSFLAIYACLSPILIKSPKDIENFKKIIEVDLRNIKPDNDELINYLFIKQYTFNENYINEERFKRSSRIAESFEDNTIDTIRSKLNISYSKQLDVQLDKTKKCNKNWPYCINDTYFENVTEIIFYTTFSRQKMGEYQEDYFFKGLKLKNEKKQKNINENGIIAKKERKEDDRYNISIERRPHYCSNANEDIIIKKNEEGIGNNIDINKEIETNVFLNNNLNNNDKEKKINKNNEQNSNTPTTSSIKSDSEEINYEEDMK